MTKRPSRWTTRQVETADGVVLDVAEQGQGAERDQGGPGARPVLLLHGFPQTHRSFDALAERLIDRSGGGLWLLAPDQRGYSPGARPADVKAYAIGNLVSDALSVLDAYGIEAADVVGHDWGAIVGWNLAARHPDRVRTLTAVSVPHPKALAQALADPAGGQAERSSYMKLFRLPGKAEEVLLEDNAARLRAIYDPLSDEAAEPHVKALSSPDALTGALNWYRAMRTQDSVSLPPVTVPTTYVWSTADVAIGRVAAERCAAQVTGPYRFVELDGISHWIPDQAPDALADVVMDRLGLK